MLPSCHSGQAETLCFLSYFHLLLYARKQERRVEPHFIFRTSTKLNCMKNSTTENRHRRRFPLLFFFANAFLSSKENILHVLCILYNLGLYIGGDYIGYTYGGHAKGFFFQICLFLGCKWAFFSLCLVPKFPQATKMAKHFASRNELENHVQIAIILKEHITNVQYRENTIKKLFNKTFAPKTFFT